MLRIEIENDTTVHRLRSHQQRGHSVVRSLHAGNNYPSNLGLLAAGIPAFAYAHTYGEKDKNYHPHLVICDGRSEQLGPRDHLLTHARVTSAPRAFGEYFPIGQSLLQGHMGALRDAVPGCDCVVYGDYLRRHSNLVEGILEQSTYHWADLDVRTKGRSELWHRRVDSDGNILDSHTNGWGAVGGSVYGITDQKQGWIVPNILNVLITAIVESERTGHPVVWHLSGPDMVTYIGSMSTQLTLLHQAMRGKLRLKFEELTFKLVPTADFRFVVPYHKRESLDHLVQEYLKLLAFEEDTRNRLRSRSPEDKPNPIIDEVTRARKSLNENLRNAIMLCPEIFYDVKKADFFSQYDLLQLRARAGRGGDFLYVHPWSVNASPKELSDAMRMLWRIKRHSPSK